MALQKGREAVQAVQDAFAVIEAVYREDQLAVAEKPAVFSTASRTCIFDAALW